MNISSRQKIVVTICVIVAALLLMGRYFFAKPVGDVDVITFQRLKELRNEKKILTQKYFQSLEMTAKNLAQDSEMHAYYSRLREVGGEYPTQLSVDFDKYFIDNYRDFYDVLLVDITGFVFHSFRQEDDYHQNLFNGDLGNTKLSKLLKHTNATQFSDFEYYSPSGESAAFFITPQYDDGNHIGWFVLQCAINKVNTILTDRNKMARTEEVYLINDEKLMLSDSRFIEDGTILKLKVDTESVRQALNGRSGESIIVDYRGARVYSSYEKFDYFNTSWIIIAEIDESEVITEFYKNNKSQFNDIKPSSAPQTDNVAPWQISPSMVNSKVDMSEWAKGVDGEILFTNGVSTCTAFAIRYPHRFAYLAHLSPVDAAYGIEGLAAYILKDRSTDFVQELTKRVLHYDVYPYELSDLEFLIVATHKNSFSFIVDRLIEQGIDLEQIKFIYNPDAQNVSLYLDISQNLTQIEWSSGSSVIIENAANYDNLGQIVRESIH